jgi:hypothetical protein
MEELRETTKSLWIVTVFSDTRSKPLPNKSAECHICARAFNEIPKSALQSSVDTIFTNRFKIKKFHMLPTQCIYVFYSGSQNKQ